MAEFNIDLLGAALSFPGNGTTGNQAATDHLSDFHGRPAAPTPSALASDPGNSAPASGIAPPATTFQSGTGDADAPFHLIPMNTLTRPEDREGWLPKEAAEKCRLLREAKQESHALWRALSPDIDHIRAELARVRSELETAVKEVTRQLSRGKLEDRLADDPTVKSLRVRVEKYEAELFRLQERQQPHADRQDALGRVINALEAYLPQLPIERDNAGKPHISVKIAPAAKPSKGDTIEAAIERVAQLRADVLEVEAAPHTAEETKAHITAEIEFIAKQGEPSAVRCLLNGSNLAWKSGKEHGDKVRTIRIPAFGVVDDNGRPSQWAETEIGAADAFTIWANRDAILAKLCAEIDEISDDEIALPAKERADKLTKLAANILSEERIVSELIWRDRAFDRWPEHIDPRAVIGIAGPAPRN